MRSRANLRIWGYAAKDAERGKTQSGRDCAKFRVGVSRFHKDKESGKFVDDSSIWFNVFAFDDIDAVCRDVKKGLAVSVEGKPAFSAYTSTETGNPLVNLTIFAYSVSLVCRDKKKSQSDDDKSSDAKTAESDGDPFGGETADFGGEDGFDADADIPF
jgi:single-stranded DNA-binding protein